MACMLHLNILLLSFLHSCIYPLSAFLPLPFPVLSPCCSLCLSPTCLWASVNAPLYTGNTIAAVTLSLLAIHTVWKPTSSWNSPCQFFKLIISLFLLFTEQLSCRALSSDSSWKESFSALFVTLKNFCISGSLFCTVWKTMQCFDLWMYQ